MKIIKSLESLLFFLNHRLQEELESHEMFISLSLFILRNSNPCSMIVNQKENNRRPTKKMWCVAEILKVRNVCINLRVKRSTASVFSLSMLVRVCFPDYDMLLWDLLLLYFILTLIFIWSPLFYILPPFKKKFQDTSISSWQSSAFFPPIQQACCWIFKHQHFHLLWLDIVILGNLNTLEVFSNLVWFDQCPSLTLKAQKKVFQAP